MFGIRQIRALECFLLAQGQMHSIKWIYAAYCQGKVVSRLNKVVLQKEQDKRVVSYKVRSQISKQ